MDKQTDKLTWPLYKRIGLSADSLKRIEDVVEDMAKLEVNKREVKGDEKGFEQLSDHWLKFKIWKVEQEWAAE